MLQTTPPISRNNAMPTGQGPALELKGSVFTLTVIRLRNTDIDAIEDELAQRLAQAPRFFRHAPVVIDLHEVRDTTQALDFFALVALLRRHELVPVGVRKGSPAQSEAAVAAGLAALQGGTIQELGVAAADNPKEKEPEDRISMAAPAPQAPPAAPEAATAGHTRVIRQPVRSGQRIYARGGDLLILAPVSTGAEIMADGHIHVYAPLRGRALAGVSGDTGARIFALNLEPELVAIAGHYRVFEERDTNEIYGKAAQVWLEDEQLRVTAL